MPDNQNNSTQTNQIGQSTKEIYYAWYSEKQRKSTGKTFIYLNTDNKEVQTTSVSKGNTPPNFDDVRSLGKVTKWVRNIEHLDVLN